MAELALVVSLDETDLPSLPLSLLREHRAELLAECSRAAYAKRLVQAHLDLAVHATAPGEDLQGSAAPRDRVRLALAAAGTVSSDPVASLCRLEAAKADLVGYTSTLSRALREATDELVERYRKTPTACLLTLTESAAGGAPRPAVPPPAPRA